MSTDNKKGRILIMDDEEMVCEIAQQIFEYLGYQVSTAPDGMMALELYKNDFDNDPFDVVIMDLTIPGGVGGQEAVSLFLAFDADAKVVVASGYANDPVVINHRDHGFVGSLAKPFDITSAENLLAELL